MKLQMSSTNGLIVALIAVAVLVAAFWMLALSPKREEAKELGTTVENLETELAANRAEANEAEEAREGFPVDYRQLVTLGKAVPGDDDTASLLVQLNRVAKRSQVKFGTFLLKSEGGTAEPAPEAPSTEESATVSPTEAAASTMPLGATIGTAGLGVMPYKLTFEGDFFQLAGFINGLDSMVKTKTSALAVDGRLVTIDGFNLQRSSTADFPVLKATVSVTTYLTPPEVGVTAGASPSGPAAPTTATPASTTIGGTG
jgi:Tfp pilus assembly protein PilO